MNTLFVRPRDAEARARLLRNASPTAADPMRGAEGPGGFVWLRRHHEGYPPHGFYAPFGAQEASQEYGEALYVYRGDGELSAAFAYEHAEDGALLRRLAFHPCADDGGAYDADQWRALEGQPEAWEAKAFREPPALGEAEPRPSVAELAVIAHFGLAVRAPRAG